MASSNKLEVTLQDAVQLREVSHIDGGRNPVWRERLYFDIPVGVQDLELEVFHESKLSRPASIGRAKLSLSMLLPSGSCERKVTVGSGQIRVHLKLTHYSGNSAKSIASAISAAPTELSGVQLHHHMSSLESDGSTRSSSLQPASSSPWSSRLVLQDSEASVSPSRRMLQRGSSTHHNGVHASDGCWAGPEAADGYRRASSGGEHSGSSPTKGFRAKVGQKLSSFLGGIEGYIHRLDPHNLESQLSCPGSARDETAGMVQNSSHQLAIGDGGRQYSLHQQPWQQQEANLARPPQPFPAAHLGPPYYASYPSQGDSYRTSSDNARLFNQQQQRWQHPEADSRMSRLPTEEEHIQEAFPSAIPGPPSYPPYPPSQLAGPLQGSSHLQSVPDNPRPFSQQQHWQQQEADYRPTRRPAEAAHLGPSSHNPYPAFQVQGSSFRANSGPSHQQPGADNARLFSLQHQPLQGEEGRSASPPEPASAVQRGAHKYNVHQPPQWVNNVEASGAEAQPGQRGRANDGGSSSAVVSLPLRRQTAEGPSGGLQARESFWSGDAENGSGYWRGGRQVHEWAEGRGQLPPSIFPDLLQPDIPPDSSVSRERLTSAEKEASRQVSTLMGGAPRPAPLISKPLSDPPLEGEISMAQLVSEKPLAGGASNLPKQLQTIFNRARRTPTGSGPTAPPLPGSARGDTPLLDASQSATENSYNDLGQNSEGSFEAGQRAESAPPDSALTAAQPIHPDISFGSEVHSGQFEGAHHPRLLGKISQEPSKPKVKPATVLSDQRFSSVAGGGDVPDAPKSFVGFKSPFAADESPLYHDFLLTANSASVRNAGNAGSSPEAPKSFVGFTSPFAADENPLDHDGPLEANSASGAKLGNAGGSSEAPKSFVGFQSPFAADDTPLKQDLLPQATGKSASLLKAGSSAGGKVPFKDVRQAVEAAPSIRVSKSIKSDDSRPSAAQLLSGNSSDWIIEEDDLEIAVDADGKPIKLGSGAFGTVFKGVYDKSTDVAIKTLKCESERDKEEALNEVAILKHLRHPHVVQFLGASVADEHIQLVTELLAENLYTALKKNRCTWYKGGHGVARNIASALAFLHKRKIVHLDVKSANILLTSHMDAKLGDLGLSAFMGKNSFLETIKGLGTLMWSAPEVLLSSHPITSQADVYSFGTVLWEICTGEEPKRGHLRAIKEDEAPKKLVDLLWKCLDSEPDSRPTMAKIYEVLRELPEVKKPE